MQKISYRKSTRSSLATLLASTSLLLSSAALAVGTDPDRATVNEPGGAGVAQREPVMAATADGALLLFEDTRKGFFLDAGYYSDYRLSAIGMNGLPVGPSVPFMSEVYGASNISLGSNRMVHGAVALCEIQGEDGLQMVRIDSATAEPLGAPKTILADPKGHTAEGDGWVFVRDDGANLVFYRYGEFIWGRFYDSEFYPLSSAFEVFPVVNPFDITVGFHADGSFTAAFLRPLPAVPYLAQVQSKRFNADGTEAGPTYTHTTEEVNNKDLRIGTRPDGSAMIAWVNGSSFITGWRVQGILLNTTGVPETDVVLLVENEDMSTGLGGVYPKDNGTWALTQADLYSYDPAVTVCVFDGEHLTLIDNETIEGGYDASSAWLTETESVLLAWEVDPFESWADIYGSVVSTDGYGHSAPMKIADDPEAADQKEVTCASSVTGPSIVAWEDERSEERQIFMQIFSADGTRIGSNQFVTNNFGEWPAKPTLAINASGASVVGWCEEVGEAFDFMVQRYDEYGNALGSPINATSGVVECSSSSNTTLEMFDDGGFILSYRNASSSSSPSNAYVRRFEADGTPMSSSATRVNSSAAGSYGYYVFDIVTKPDGSALAFMRRSHASSGLSSIQVREIDSNGYPHSTAKTIANNLGNLYGHSAAGDDQGYSVAWYVNGVNAIQVRHYGSDGRLSASDEVVGMSGDAEDPNLSIVSDGSRCMVFKEDSFYTQPQNVRYVQYGRNGERRINPKLLVSLGDNAPTYYNTISMVTGDQVQLAYIAGSGTDQGNDVFLTSDELEVCFEADFDCDGIVDGYDLGWLLGFWGLPGGDVNGDGITDGMDLTILLGEWTG